MLEYKSIREKMLVELAMLLGLSPKEAVWLPTTFDYVGDRLDMTPNEFCTLLRRDEDVRKLLKTGITNQSNDFATYLAKDNEIEAETYSISKNWECDYTVDCICEKCE